MPPNGQLKEEKTADDLRADIERAREQIAESAATLRDQVAMTTDWREWVRRRPALFIAGAFALGFAVGYRR